jgi:LytS/YehU family sensor histidine kinase
MNLRRPVVWMWLFLFFTATGLFYFGHFYLDDLARGGSGATLPRRLMEELTGNYATLALVPWLLWIVNHAPVTRRTWPRALALNVLGWLVFSVSHTTIMALSRALLHPLFGLANYDYGNLLYRYPMEAAGDAISYAMLVSVLYFIVRLGEARAAELRAAALQRQLAEAQLENLRLQLNPHFLFNTLNAISAVMYEDVRRADTMIAKLSDFLRTVLAARGVANVPLDEELAVERQYVEIMTTRLERRLDLRISVAENAEGALVPFMLLQPLIENSIRHGMLERPSLALEILAERRGGSTVIEVNDDGSGCGANDVPGIGLTNVRSRLEHLYGGAASFSLEARSGGGTRATVAFPFSSGACA